MNTLTQSSQIQCGDHCLKAKVTFTEYRRETYIDGQPITLAEPPEITIKCLTCGKETVAKQFTVDTNMTERIFP